MAFLLLRAPSLPTATATATAITVTLSPLKPSSRSLVPSKMALTHEPMSPLSCNNASSTAQTHRRKLPVLLFDIMDTVVRDPFYEDVPPFFGMTFEELIETKHPTAWIEFEKGLIDEMELAGKFFKDGRSFDMEGLKSCMSRGYAYVDGMEDLLRTLKQNNYEMHAFTNYPIWCKLIEEKLGISTYLSWTFCSYMMGKRKPDPNFYLEVLQHLEVDPGSCIFIDDRLKNVEAATEIGITGLHFRNTKLLHDDLSRLGINADERLGL